MDFLTISDWTTANGAEDDVHGNTTDFSSTFYGRILDDNRRCQLEKLVKVCEATVQAQGSDFEDKDFFCRLGHYNLLLKRYPQALSAYQKYFKLESSYWKNSSFLYGLGIVYFHYNSYQWAIRAFQQVLYIDKNFACTKDVHLNLAIIFKTTKDYNSSKKHFDLASKESSVALVSDLEVQFHLAHIEELLENYSTAKRGYEEILNSQESPPRFKAQVYKQLGWLYETVDDLERVDQRSALQKAVELYQHSIAHCSDDGEIYYYLGRCNAALDDVQSAFGYYRSAIDKRESCPNTWCSIGVLYQQQGQPCDALQAFICAVQLDETHATAWYNLAILYERESQPRDALACYDKLLTHSKTPLASGVESRIETLRLELSSHPGYDQSPSNRRLHSIDDAWNLPIPAELTSRRQVKSLNIRRSMEPSDPQSAKRVCRGYPELEVDLTPEQFQLMKRLEQLQYSGAQLAPQDQMQLVRFQQQFQQSMMVRKSAAAFSGGVAPPGAPIMETHRGWLAPGSAPPGYPARVPQGPPPGVPPQPAPPTPATCPSTPVPGETSGGGGGVIEGEATIGSPASHRDTVADSGAREISLDLTDTLNVLSSMISKDDCAQSEGVKAEPGGSSEGATDAAQTSSEETKGEPRTEEAEIPSSIFIMSSDECIEKIKKFGTGGVDEMEILSLKVAPPQPPKAPSETFPRDKLYPPTPTVRVESRKEAHSENLMRFCLSPDQPVTVIKDLASALRLDFGLYTTKTLCETNPEHAVDVRHQLHQPGDENWSSASADAFQTWQCESSKSRSTILKYAQYQAAVFLNAQKGESSDDFSGDAGSPQPPEDIESSPRRRRPTKKKLKHIKFGTNVDLSDEKKWGPQLQEITKLPLFVRLVSGSNMLSHLGHTVLGMNTVQLYMKVPGCRTPGHQENLSFCSVNVNIGPGDCEWFAVDNKYWGVCHRLCEKNNTNFLTGSWWPLLEDLFEASVPVYRFIQKPGDLVWVNAGAVHWVQSLGFCNNIAWNVGPLTSHVYNLAIERYEWNKLQSYRSLVPMITLSWNLARNLRITEDNLYFQIKLVLVKSLKYSEMLVEHLKRQAVDIKWHGRQHQEPVPYCNTCEEEVFNILFTRVDANKKWQVYCRGCAHRISPQLQAFVILQEYKTEELRATLAHYRLYTKDASSSRS